MASGNDFRDIVAAYVGGVGYGVTLEHYTGEVFYGKRRRVDILCTSPALLTIQCKYQNSKGTAEEKLSRAIEYAKQSAIPSIIVVGGSGWSAGAVPPSPRVFNFDTERSRLREFLETLALFGIEAQGQFSLAPSDPQMPDWWAESARAHAQFEVTSAGLNKALTEFRALIRDFIRKSEEES